MDSATTASAGAWQLRENRADADLQIPSRPPAPADALSAASLRARAVASITLFAGDAASFAIAAGLLVPFGAADGQAPVVLALVAVAALLLFGSDALYPGYGVYPHELLRRRVVATARVAMLAAVAALLLAGGWHMPALILSFVGIATVVQLPVRVLLRAALARWGLWGTPTAVLGDSRDVEAVVAHLAANWQMGLYCPGSSARRHPAAALICGFKGSEGELETVRRRYESVLTVAGIPGMAAAGLRPADFQGEIGLRLRSDRSTGSAWASRALDLSVAGLALLAVAPLLLLACAAIYVVDPGPVIYRQTREGLGGRPFRMLKLRTMYRDADQRLETLLCQNEEARAEWTRCYKLRNDPRILPVIGSFLRASSIDELPQLLNVIRGDMRIVGPRPFPIYHVAAMDAAFRAKRCTVTPGVTGLWQISGRSNSDLQRQQELDEFYIDNRSFWLDVHIVSRTFAAVFRHDGAY